MGHDEYYTTPLYARADSDRKRQERLSILPEYNFFNRDGD